MLKFITALSAVVIVAWGLVGSAATANAGYGYRHHGGCCGHVKPSYTYNTKRVYKNITRYRDVWRSRYVHRTKRYVHVTRIQPIYHIHNVKRVHTRIVAVVRPVHVRMTQYLPAKRYVTSSVVHLRPHCACSSHRHY